MTLRATCCAIGRLIRRAYGSLVMSVDVVVHPCRRANWMNSSSQGVLACFSGVTTFVTFNVAPVSISGRSVVWDTEVFCCP